MLDDIDIELYEHVAQVAKTDHIYTLDTSHLI